MAAEERQTASGSSAGAAQALTGRASRRARPPPMFDRASECNAAEFQMEHPTVAQVFGPGSEAGLAGWLAGTQPAAATVPAAVPSGPEDRETWGETRSTERGGASLESVQQAAPWMDLNLEVTRAAAAVPVQGGVLDSSRQGC